MPTSALPAAVITRSIKAKIPTQDPLPAWEDITDRPGAEEDATMGGPARHRGGEGCGFTAMVFDIDERGHGMRRRLAHQEDLRLLQVSVDASLCDDDPIVAAI